MNIEEIRKSRAQAECKIMEILEVLKSETGMSVTRLDVNFANIYPVGRTDRLSVVCSVQIRLEPI